MWRGFPFPPKKRKMYFHMRGQYKGNIGVIISYFLGVLKQEVLRVHGIGGHLDGFSPNPKQFTLNPTLNPINPISRTARPTTRMAFSNTTAPTTCAAVAFMGV